MPDSPYSDLGELPPLPMSDGPSETNSFNGDHDAGLTSPASPSNPPSITRTVAIIKNHALEHRFDIEPRIQEASFEIVKERQMEFDMSDPEVLYDLFGEDADSFAEGPVWVYVLERRRAVEVWNTLMGPGDPSVARQSAPHSLRALYGLSPHQNAVMGSPDAQTAEIQIAALFVSSPPFPIADLPPSDEIGLGMYSPEGTRSLRSVSSSVLSALRKAGDVLQTSDGKVRFKARPIPSTIAGTPSIVPRSSRAADLRAGIAVEQSPSGRRAPLTAEQIAKTFANVPGHKRQTTFAVASTAPPAVAPRMTKAASLRMGIKPDSKPVPALRSRAASADGSTTAKSNESEEALKRATFDGVPGHKRRESIPVASTKAPSVAPRMNRSAQLRAQKEAAKAPPSSFMFRSSSEQRPPSRSASRNSMSGPPPSSRPSLSRSSSTSANPTPSRPPSVSRAAPASLSRATSRRVSYDGASAPSPRPPSTEPSKPQRKPRPTSLQGPAIAPRTNKSATLRAAKMDAAAATNGTNGAGKTKARPIAAWI